MSIVRLSRGATCSTILGQHQQTKAVLFTGVELCLHTFNVLPSPVELYSTFDKPLSILPTNSIIAHTHYTCSFASFKQLQFRIIGIRPGVIVWDFPKDD